MPKRPFLGCVIKNVSKCWIGFRNFDDFQEFDGAYISNYWLLLLRKLWFEEEKHFMALQNKIENTAHFEHI